MIRHIYESTFGTGERKYSLRTFVQIALNAATYKTFYGSDVRNNPVTSENIKRCLSHSNIGSSKSAALNTELLHGILQHHIQDAEVNRLEQAIVPMKLDQHSELHNAVWREFYSEIEPALKSYISTQPKTRINGIELDPFASYEMLYKAFKNSEYTDINLMGPKRVTEADVREAVYDTLCAVIQFLRSTNSDGEPFYLKFEDILVDLTRDLAISLAPEDYNADNIYYNYIYQLTKIKLEQAIIDAFNMKHEKENFPTPPEYIKKNQVVPDAVKKSVGEDFIEELSNLHLDTDATIFEEEIKPIARTVAYKYMKELSPDKMGNLVKSVHKWKHTDRRYNESLSKHKKLHEADYITLGGKRLPIDMSGYDDTVSYDDAVQRGEEMYKQEQETSALNQRKQAGEKLHKLCVDESSRFTNNEDKVSTMFSILVPSSGIANTVAGEIIRAMMRVMYRYWNDGDVFFEGYGYETSGPSMQYLMDMVPEVAEYTKKFLNHIDVDAIIFDGGFDDIGYEAFEDKICSLVLNYLTNSPELFANGNEIDSRDCPITDFEQLTFDFDINLDEFTYYNELDSEEQDEVKDSLCAEFEQHDVTEDFRDTLIVHDLTLYEYQDAVKRIDRVVDEIIQDIYDEYDEEDDFDEEDAD